MVGRELQKFRPKGEDHQGLIGGRVREQTMQDIDMRRTTIDSKN